MQGMRCELSPGRSCRARPGRRARPRHLHDRPRPGDQRLPRPQPDPNPGHEHDPGFDRGDGRPGRRARQLPRLLARPGREALSTATEITLIAAGFFLVLALIALLRALYVKVRPPRRWSVGVFVERGREAQPASPADWPHPSEEAREDDTGLSP